MSQSKPDFKQNGNDSLIGMQTIYIQAVTDPQSGTAEVNRGRERLSTWVPSLWENLHTHTHSVCPSDSSFSPVLFHSNNLIYVSGVPVSSIMSRLTSSVK